MKVLVAYESSEICDCIIGVVSDVPIAEVIWQNTHLDAWLMDDRENRPDIAILDAGSTSINGIVVMKKMKTLRQPPVVIMTSSVPYRQYKDECLKQGADYFFYLPDEIDQLARTIEWLTTGVHSECR